MKPKILLKIASVLMLLHALGHTIGIITWQKLNSNVPNDLIQKMQETHFVFQGKDATMAKFFSGHGYAGTILLLMTAILLWTFSSASSTESRKVLFVIATAVLCLAVVEYVYFFPMAVVFSIFTLLLIIIALLKTKQNT